MASRIITKKGSGAPLASDLVHGELAVDTVNKRLYTENAGGTVVEVGTSPSTIDINAGTIDGTVIGGTTAAAGTFTTGQFDTSVNVDGTVTADGLTVDGASAGRVTLGTFTNTTSAGGTEAALVLRSVNSVCEVSLVASRVASNAGSDFYIETSDGVDGTNRKRLNIAEDGDISFYEDTGTTPKFYWDASAESLGIGTSSPTRTLSVVSSAQYVANFTRSSGTAYISLNDSSTTNEAYVGVGAIGDDFSVRAGNGERLRITSAGNVGIGTSNPAEKLNISGSGTQRIRITETGSGLFTQIVQTSTNTSIVAAAPAATDNYLTFLTTSSGSSSEAMRIDSAGNVGIGTTSPESGLHVLKGTADVFRLERDSTNDWRFQLTGGALAFRDATNDSERVRIDASGNLLVGKTTTAFGTEGIRLEGSNGKIEITRDNNIPLAINRLTSDGDLAQFYKDGAVVGSIGTRAAYVKIGNGDTNLLFNSAANAITPEDAAANSDGILDLGRTTSRFKDLYLSGGVYLGGTAAANHLDDYEEGTWTPNSTASGFSDAQGYYTKVGDTVTAWYKFTIDSTSSAIVRISSFPFAASSAGYFGVITRSTANDNAEGAYQWRGSEFNIDLVESDGTTKPSHSTVNGEAFDGFFTYKV